MVPPVGIAVVERQPRPPRDVPAGSLLKAVLADRTSWWLAGAGLVAVFIGAVYPTARTAYDPPLFGMAFIGFGLAVAAVPLIFYRRLLNALRNAPVGVAEVLQVDVAQRSQNTLDAIEHGFASGTWRVTVDGRAPFVENFEVDEPFARRLRPGSRVRVLVAPEKQRSVFHLTLQGTIEG